MVLKYLKDNGRTKSGIMLGLGETKEVIEAMRELRADVDAPHFRQYSAYSHLPVVEFVTPEVFEEPKK